MAPASSWSFSRIRPISASSTADSSPASPRTPICDERPLDCTTSTSSADEARAAVSPPFVAAAPVVDKDVSSRDNNIEDAVVFSLIERLDDGWFRENVMSYQWRNFFSFSRRRPSTGEVMLWDLSDSTVGEGIRSPESSKGGKSPSSRAVSHLSPFKSIEMVQPLVGSGSSSADRDARDSRDLPSSRLRRLQRRLHDEETSFSDGEQRRYSITKSEGATSVGRFADFKFESAKARAGARRRKEKQIAKAVAGLPRRFSDGEEPGEEVSAPLGKVKEEILAEIEGNSRKSSKSKSSKNKIHGSTNVERQASKAATVGKQQQNLEVSLLETNSLPVPAASRQRRRERRKISKSLTDAEYDELRGCIDLGFNFSRDDLTPRVVSVIPALKFYKAGDDILNSPNRSSPRGRASNPSPQGWSPRDWSSRRPDSPLLKWRIPSARDSNVDMKAHLKFWAHSVASTVSAEC